MPSGGVGNRVASTRVAISGKALPALCMAIDLCGVLVIICFRPAGTDRPPKHSLSVKPTLLLALARSSGGFMRPGILLIAPQGVPQGSRTMPGQSIHLS